MENILNYTLSLSGAAPSEALCGGYSGEHRATAAVFTPDEEFSAAIAEAETEGYTPVCRIDFVTEAGEYFKGGERDIADISSPFYLTGAMTASGLDSLIILRIILKSGDEAVRELYKAQVAVWFKESGLPAGPISLKEETGGLKTAEELAAIIDEKTEEASELLDSKVSSASASAATAAAQLKSVIRLAEECEKSADDAKASSATAGELAEECKEALDLMEQTAHAAGEFSNTAEKAATRAEEAASQGEQSAELCRQAALTAAESAEEAENFAAAAEEQAGKALECEEKVQKTAEEMSSYPALFSNALKGEATGETVRINDVSPTHRTVEITLHSEETNDLSSVKLMAYGKNLFDSAAWIDYCNSGIGSSGSISTTWLGEECFSYTAYMNSGAARFTDFPFKENTQYTISAELSFYFGSNESYSMPFIMVNYTDGTYYFEQPTSYSTKFTKVSWTTAAGKTVKSLGIPRFGAGVKIYCKWLQIEAATSATGYEPYAEPAEYAVSADGKVEGLDAISSDVTLITDTAGVSVTCKYNRDINAAVEELAQAIISLGGNI